MADERKPALVKIPSDALRALLNLRDEFPAFRQLLDDILQIVVVLDASAVQGELRWRLGSRTNPNARTGLHEAIDSSAVIAVAPIFLRHEILLYVPCASGHGREKVAGAFRKEIARRKLRAVAGARADCSSAVPISRSPVRLIRGRHGSNKIAAGKGERRATPISNWNAACFPVRHLPHGKTGNW